jgi:acetyl esterase/lipase
MVEREMDARPGTVLYFHGGGNVFGSPETSLQLTANLVVRTGFRAFSLDYRLAPEHPFPAGADDALNAYRALLDRSENPAAIAFAGDSRGGGLRVLDVEQPRDRGLPVRADGLDLDRPRLVDHGLHSRGADRRADTGRVRLVGRGLEGKHFHD